MPIKPRRRGSSDFPFPYLETKAKTYEVVHVFVFHGSSVIGEPKSIKVLGGLADSKEEGISVRIYDVTNANLIAELVEAEDDWPAVLDLGQISNVPDGESVWELQVKSKKKKKVAVAHLVMEF